MSDHDIKARLAERLAELHDELEQTQAVDDDLRNLLMEVDAEIHELLDPGEHEPPAIDGLHERLEGLAADFAARHPNTERFFQELIAALGRMGI